MATTTTRRAPSPDHRTTAFAAALGTVCLSLAKQIVEDGEGIQHVVELAIDGALTDADALAIARSIAHSPLVKTAWAGCDPNSGAHLGSYRLCGCRHRSSSNQYFVRRIRSPRGRFYLT